MTPVFGTGRNAEMVLLAAGVGAGVGVRIGGAFLAPAAEAFNPGHPIGARRAGSIAPIQAICFSYRTHRQTLRGSVPPARTRVPRTFWRADMAHVYGIDEQGQQLIAKVQGIVRDVVAKHAA